jgi:hypothetical protein
MVDKVFKCSQIPENKENVLWEMFYIETNGAYMHGLLRHLYLSYFVLWMCIKVFEVSLINTDNSQLITSYFE